MRANPGEVAGGAGMSEVLDESALEHILTMSRSGTTDAQVNPPALEPSFPAQTELLC
jgi:hypothetical protein